MIAGAIIGSAKSSGPTVVASRSALQAAPGRGPSDIYGDRKPFSLEEVLGYSFSPRTNSDVWISGQSNSSFISHLLSIDVDSSKELISSIVVRLCLVVVMDYIGLLYSFYILVFIYFGTYIFMGDSRLD